MPELRTCASCGEKAELCGSCSSDGIQQPKMCKKCLIEAMGTDFENQKINDVYYLRQLAEADDKQSFDGLIKGFSEDERTKLGLLYKLWRDKDEKAFEAEKAKLFDVQGAQDARVEPVEAKRVGCTKKIRKGK